jgi:ABC-type Fe3+-hydroxamate transport system substrate-binding protein
VSDFNLTEPPRRVVSLVPSVTESLFDLGCGERVVGVTEYCIHPAAGVAGLPKIGGTKNPDLGAIRALQPDLIIANQEENRKDDVDALRAGGCNVWVTFPCTVAQTFQHLWDIVRLFDVPQMSQSIDAIERVYEWAARAAEDNPGVGVFVPIWREPKGTDSPRWWMTFNRGAYAHDLLRVCGGANIFAERVRRYPLAADLGEAPPVEPSPEHDTRYPRVTPAEVAARSPQVILLPSEPYPFTEADRAAFDSFPDLPAVQHNRIYPVDGTLLTWPGTRVGRALAEVPAFLSGIGVDDERA